MVTLEYDLPRWVQKEIQEKRFIKEDDSRYMRYCSIEISENHPLTYIDPESFDYSDVHGKCKLAQGMFLVSDKEAVITPIVISEFEHQKNVRSFEKEAFSKN